MKIAVITSGILPVPAVKGGAVENLIEFYLEKNEALGLHDITVFSVYDSCVSKSSVSINSNKHIHFFFVHDKSFWYRIKRKIYSYFYKKGYYNSHIDFFLYNVLKQIKKKKYDIIVLENRPGYTIKIHSASPGSKIILHLHNDLLNSSTDNAHYIKSLLYRIITVSNYIKQRVDSIGGKENTAVCLNGIDLHVFQKEIDRKLVRNSIGIFDGDFVIVYSGRVMPEKGVKELLEGFKNLVSIPNIKLLIVGGSFFGDSKSDNSYIKSLKQLVSEYSNRIIFTGFLPYKRIPELLKCADVGIVPSIWDEPCSLTSIEGMAAGLPMIVTRSGGIPEFVNEKSALILIRDHDLPKSISDAILHLYNNKELRSKMAECSLERSLLFDKDIYCQKFLDLLN